MCLITGTKACVTFPKFGKWCIIIGAYSWTNKGLSGPSLSMGFDFKFGGQYFVLFATIILMIVVLFLLVYGAAMKRLPRLAVRNNINSFVLSSNVMSL